MEYNTSSHWVSRLINESPLPLAHPVLVGALTYGTVPAVGFSVLVLVRGDRIAPEFLWGLAFGQVWLALGPILIWYYDERVLPTFFSEVEELVVDDERIATLAQRYDSLFGERYVLPVVAWTVLVVAVFVVATPAFAAAGLFSTGGIFYWLFLGGTIWTAILSGTGFMGVATTILAIRAVANEELDIDPLHPDNLGGLSTVGYYAIRTTLTFSSGSLFLPLAFAYLASTRGPDIVVHVLVGLYTAAIAASFVYPTVKINRRAGELRDGTLDDLRKRYREAKVSLPAVDGGDGGADLAELRTELQLQRLRNEYQDYNDVNLYPLQLDILVRLISSVILPVVFLFLEAYLGRVLALVT